MTDNIAATTSELPGLCCFYLKYGKCEPPRGHCRFRHDQMDDGVTPCGFGASCRLGHARRFKYCCQVTTDDATTTTTMAKELQKAKLQYWTAYNNNTSKLRNPQNSSTNSNNNNPHRQPQRRQQQHLNVVGDSPAVRDATLLRSQLEPWPTAALRDRLVHVFGESYDTWDQAHVTRSAIMERLLHHYAASNGRRQRRVVRVQGTPVPTDLLKQLETELQSWRQHYTTNTRPSIAASSYMILRSPREFGSKSASRKAQQAARKLVKYQCLWDLAAAALMQVDIVYAQQFSALAVTYNFRGSPHIDKQNTRPFYGLALGNFENGQGGIMVEVDAFTVAHVNTKHCLAKVDGRYPHWVAPYDRVNGDGQPVERYSLIYYSTWQQYQAPGPAYFGTVVEDL